jgi:hypothetical protein
VDENREEQRREEALKRYLVVFKQMSTLATAAMLIVLALRGQEVAIAPAALAIAMIGFGVSLWQALLGMYLAARLGPGRGNLDGLRSQLYWSWLAFALGLYLAIGAHVLIESGGGFWLWASVVSAAIFVAVVSWLQVKAPSP